MKSILLFLLFFAMAYPYTLPDATSRVLVFSDQMNESPGTANFTFNATHYVGMQKVDKARIDAYRQINSNFIVLQYHKAYGTDLGGNITNATPPYWNNDCDTFYAWVSRHPSYGSLESYYIHSGGVIDSAHRVQHFWNNALEYYLADLRTDGWKNYVAEVTSSRCSAIGFDGTFYDAAYFPNYGYVPANWCETAPFNAPAFTQFGPTWNNSFAVPYFAFIRNYYHSGGRNQLCIVNCDQMITGWYDDAYMDSTDGGMVEGFFTYGNRLTGSDWQLSASRILKYMTGAGKNKVMLAQCSPGETDLLQRRWCIANYLLIKNKYSYYNNAYGSASNWWPEYEINLGNFSSQPAGLSDLLVSGTTSLYKRDYAAGLVLVNPGAAAQNFTLIGNYQPITFSGGGNVNNGIVPPSSLLTYGTAVSGAVTVNPGEALILQKVVNPVVESPPGQHPSENRGLLVKIYSISGKRVATLKSGAGRFLPGTLGLKSGIYFAVTESRNTKTPIQKLVVLK